MSRFMYVTLLILWGQAIAFGKTEYEACCKFDVVDNYAKAQVIFKKKIKEKIRMELKKQNIELEEGFDLDLEFRAMHIHYLTISRDPVTRLGRYLRDEIPSNWSMTVYLKTTKVTSVKGREIEISTSKSNGPIAKMYLDYSLPNRNCSGSCGEWPGNHTCRFIILSEGTFVDGGHGELYVKNSNGEKVVKLSLEKFARSIESRTVFEVPWALYDDYNFDQCRSISL